MDLNKNKFYDASAEATSSVPEGGEKQVPKEVPAAGEFSADQATAIFKKVLDKYERIIRDAIGNDVEKSAETIKKFREGVVKKIAPEADAKMSIKDAIKEKVASFDTTQEIKDIVSTMKQDVLKDLSIEDQQVVDKIINSEAFALAKTGKILKKTDVQKTVESAASFRKKIEAGATKDLTGLRADVADGNPLMKIGADVARGLLGMSGNGASDQEMLSFMGMFTPAAMGSMKTLASKEIDLSKFDYRNIGSSFQKMYSESLRFQAIPGKELFSKVLLNKGNNAFIHILESLKTMPDKGALSEEYTALKKLYNTLKNPENLSPSMKNALISAGIRSDDFETMKSELKEQIDQVQGVMNIVEGFKDFKPDELDLLMKVLKEGGNAEAAFNAFAVTFTLLKYGVIAASTAVGGPAGAAISTGAFASLHLAMVSTGVIHDVVSDEDIAKGHTFSTKAEQAVPGEVPATERKEKEEKTEEVNMQKYLTAIAEDAMDGIRDKYIHTQVDLGDNKNATAYEVAFGKSEKSLQNANKAFHRALIYNMLSSINPELVKRDDIHARIIKAAGGEAALMSKDFLKTGLLSTLTTLAGAEYEKAIDRTKLTTGLQDMVRRAATGIKNPKDPTNVYKASTDAEWSYTISDADILMRISDKNEENDYVDPFQAKEKEKQHTDLLNTMDKQWQEIGLEQHMTSGEHVLFGLLSSLQEPNWQKNYKVRDIQDAFIKNADAFFSLYTKLQKNGGKVADYLNTYEKVKNQEDGMHVFDKIVAGERRNEIDAIKMLMDMDPIQMGQLKEAQGTYQGWEWFKIAMSALGIAMDIVAVGQGIDAYKNLSKGVQQIVKTGEIANKTQESAKQIFTSKERKEQLQMLQQALEREGLAEKNAILSNLTDSDLVEMKTWDKSMWKIIKDMEYLKDGTKIGIQKSVLTHDTVLRMREWGDILKDPQKFQKFSLYLMHGSANFVYPNQRVALEGINTVQLARDPAYFLKMLIEHPAFANEQALFMKKEWARVFEYTGIDYYQMFVDVAEKSLEQEKRLAQMIFADSVKIVTTNGADSAKTVLPSLATIILGCTMANEAVNTTSFQLTNPFDTPANRLKDILDLEKRGEWIARSMKDPALREAFYHKYAPKKIKESGEIRDTSVDQKSLIKTILENDKIVLDQLLESSRDMDPLRAREIQATLSNEFEKERKKALGDLEK